MRAGLLDGLKVIDLSLWQPGHTATALLADLGAEVLKVEPPGGDRMRPQRDRFRNYNGHKRSVVLDLKQPTERERLFGLVAQAEVLVHNFRAAVLDRLDLSFETLVAANPSLVVCSITGFGQSGPLSHVAGHDYTVQAYAGAFSAVPGGAPVPAGLLVADQGAGAMAAFAICAAVLRARASGEPESIDVAMADVVAAWVAPAGSMDGAGPAPGRFGLPALGGFATGDGQWVELGVYSEDHLWDALCEVLALSGLVGIRFEERSSRGTELRSRIAAAVAAWDRDELVGVLADHGVPVAPVLSRSEMLTHEHYRERGVIHTDPSGGFRVGHPVRYRQHPARQPGPSPALGEHDGFQKAPGS